MIEVAKVNALHEKAMEHAEQALLETEPERARDFLVDAMFGEFHAAFLLRDAFDQEPTRSVLFRSAATLALDCQAYDIAESLIRQGLRGHPPEPVAEELEDLRQRIEESRPLDESDAQEAETAHDNKSRF